MRFKPGQASGVQGPAQRVSSTGERGCGGRRGWCWACGSPRWPWPCRRSWRCTACSARTWATASPPRRRPTGVNFDWWNEFLAQTAGVGQTLRAGHPRLRGGDEEPERGGRRRAACPPRSIARDRGADARCRCSWRAACSTGSRAIGPSAPARSSRRAASSSSASLRLAVIAGACYWLLFAALHPWLFGTVYPRAASRPHGGAHGVCLPRGALRGVRPAGAGGERGVDYAKIRAVVEDRRSMIGALVGGRAVRAPGTRATWPASTRSTRRCFAGVLAIYVTVAPGASARLWPSRSASSTSSCA